MTDSLSSEEKAPGLCSKCNGEVRVKTNGTLFAHNRVDLACSTGGLSSAGWVKSRCAGSGTKPRFIMNEVTLTSKSRSERSQNLRRVIGCFLLEGDGESDTLAVALCSYFERHRNRPKLDPETENGWGEWVEQKANKALDGLVARVEDVPAHETLPVARATPEDGCGCIERTNGVGGVTQVWCGMHWAQRAASLCEDCPPVGYPTDKTRCTPCPRRTLKANGLQQEFDGAIQRLEAHPPCSIANMWQCGSCLTFNPLLSLACQGCKTPRGELNGEPAHGD